MNKVFERIKSWFAHDMKVVLIPKDYKSVLVTVGNAEHPVTLKEIDDWAKEISWHIKHKSKVVAVPHWVELTVLK